MALIRRATWDHRFLLSALAVAVVGALPLAYFSAGTEIFSGTVVEEVAPQRPPNEAPLAAPVIEPNRIIYLVPENIEPTKLPASFEELQGLGVTIVHTFADLQAGTGPGTIGIIIDRDSITEVGPAGLPWLIDRFNEGKVTGGMRVSGAELAAQLPYGSDLGGMGPYVPGRVFYALVAKQNKGDFGCRSASSDYLDRGHEVGLRGLQLMIRQVERNAICEKAPVPASTPVR